MILAIGGWPRAGKSTLGAELALRSGTALLHTDGLMRLGWSGCSAAVAARILTAHADLIVEGVAVWRALRKVLALTDAAPCDRVIALRPLADRLTSTSYAAALARDPSVALSPRQLAMGKGCDTVLAEIWPELARRGVAVEHT